LGFRIGDTPAKYHGNSPRYVFVIGVTRIAGVLRTWAGAFKISRTHFHITVIHS
jgi:hypothetical protein